MDVTKDELTRLETYLRKTFGAASLEVRPQPKKTTWLKFLSMEISSPRFIASMKMARSSTNCKWPSWKWTLKKHDAVSSFCLPPALRSNPGDPHDLFLS